MASESEVANLAAVRMGTAVRITSLDDNRTVARTLKAVWAAERQATIRDGSWNFATRTVQLPVVDPATLDGGAVPLPWANAFRLPPGCLRLLEVVDLTARDAFERQGDLVLCDGDAPLNVRICIDMPEMGGWDADAVAAFALRLAWRCGHKIAGSAFDAQACWAEYREASMRAKAIDAREMPPIAQEESDWITARMTGRW